MKQCDYNKIFTKYTGAEGDLMPILQTIQKNTGFISEDAMRNISRFLKLSENQIYGVATFYSQFKFNEPGRNIIKVCLGTACHVKGGQKLVETIQRELHISDGQTTKDKRFQFERVACLGCCALAPVVQINEDIYSQVTVIHLKDILDNYK